MKKVIIALAATLAFINFSHAALTPETKVLAGKLLETMDMEKQMAQSFEMMKQSMPAMIKQMGISGESATEQQILLKKVMDLVAEEMSWDKLKDDYVAIYAETFTEEELKGLVDFYNSPVGKKFTAKQPELMQRSMQVSQSKMMTLIPKIQAMATQPQE